MKAHVDLFKMDAHRDSIHNNANLWADSIMKKMDWDQKIGQLFMVEAYSNKDDEHLSSLLSMV
ncbi:MAG: hypothetical protein ACKPAD_12890, partial [Bacteroidota bacterium]